MLDTALKICSICNVAKPLDQFAGRTRSPDGRQYHCRDCGRRALDAADARRATERAAAREQAQRAALASTPLRPPPMPWWLPEYERAALSEEGPPTDGPDRDDARDEYARDALEWALQAYAAGVVDALLAAALDGAAQPYGYIRERVLGPWADDEALTTPEHYAYDALYQYEQMHTDQLLERLPADVQAPLRALLEADPPPAD
jgi:hypothetical protein